MKLLVLSLFIVLGFNACTTRHNTDGSYERANSASEKALIGLERDTK